MADSISNAPKTISTMDLIQDDIYGGENFRAEIVLVLKGNGTATIDMRSLPVNGWVENNAAKSGTQVQWTARNADDAYIRPDTDVIEAIIAEIAPLLERVHAGHLLYEEYWAPVGSLNEDAEAARAEIQDILEDHEWWTQEDVVDALDWLESIDWADVQVSASSENADLHALVEPLTRRALEEESVVVHNVFYALDYRRSALEEAEDDR